MNEQEALARMISPGMKRPGKLGGFGGVIQILVTSSCNLACHHCTQASQLARPKWFMTPEQFEQAVLSLRGYFGVYGVFGGNPAVSPHFLSYCEIVRRHVPKAQAGIWCNNPLTPEKARAMRETFDHRVSNLNVHLDRKAYDLFKTYWPESMPFGLDKDSRHSPPFVAMKDVLKTECVYCGGHGVETPGTPFPETPCEHCGGTGQTYDEARAWDLISRCDVNQHWSAGLGVFRGQLRAWFCELAMAQSILHQDDPDYPDTGIPIQVPKPETVAHVRRVSAEMGFNDVDVPVGGVLSGHFHTGEPPVQPWWRLPMQGFASQVRKHCHECSVPLRGYGALAQGPEDQPEQTSATHADVYRPKRPGRRVEVVTSLEQLGVGRLQRATDYLGNSAR